MAGLSGEPGAAWMGADRRVEPRRAIEWAAGTGARAVQLDATLDGIRPRQLDRSARRDLAALLRRLELSLSGLDAWIPPEHLVDAARVDRAMDALLMAIEMAQELAGLVGGASRGVVSMALPEGLGDGLREQLAGHAERCGVLIADHRVGAVATEGVALGVDPAAVLLAGGDPATAAARAGMSLATARLSDADVVARAEPGRGRLDVLNYAMSTRVAGYAGPMVVDVRGLRASAQATAVTAWAERLAALPEVGA